jgi:hypothetical protein
MTIQQLISDMEQYHSDTGYYRPEDVYRLVGDPRKGIGFGLSNLAHADNCGATPHQSSSSETSSSDQT